MKKTSFLAAGLTVVMLVAGPAGAQTPSPPGHSVSAMDVDLAERVRRSVVADRNLSTYAAKITIVATDGSIRLSGKVQNEGEKAQIGSKAAAIVGQRHVVNDLELMPAATTGTALRDSVR